MSLKDDLKRIFFGAKSIAKSKLMQTLDLEPKVAKTFTISKLWYAAAAILIVLSIGLFVANQNSSKTYLAKVGETLDIELPDHSIIQLQGGSELKLDNGFNTNSRNLNLNGVAYFKVAKNKNLPFIIHTNKADVTVVGTEFLVQARAVSDYFQVKVSEGKVKVNNQTQTIYLTKGMAVYTNQAQVLNTNTDITNTNEIQFINAKLIDVITDIEQRFGVVLKYDKTLDETKITIRTNANNASEIAEILGETVGTSVTLSK